MQKKNSRFLIILALVFIVGTGVFAVVLYERSIAYAKVQNERHLHEILMRQKALHKYVEETLKPVIYTLKAEGKLYEEFFDPKVLSFTYIARSIHANLNTLQQSDQSKRVFAEGELYYKLATDNPRNERNRATPKEELILNRFRRGEIDAYSEVIEEKGHRYIYHAIAVEPNVASCMRCHSTPDVAPKEMVAMYGSEKGFGEAVGNIRAIISLKVPFDHELGEAMWLFRLTVGALALFLTPLYGVIFFFVRRLDRQEQIIRSYNETLQSEAEHDPLTDVYNRRSFERTLQHLCGREAFVLAIFDIDHFKKVNDTYGHPLGDTILKELTALVRDQIRVDDCLYRIGGEEFAIVSTGQGIESVEKLFGRLYKAIESYRFSHDLRITISTGIAAAGINEQPTALMQRADEALYAAKAAGRACIVVGT
ncbi:MAG: diguanylate cyclase [Campylobacterales bacterium]|nr:diguanylate cyclase [Campylobacterales bacterium]